MNYPIIPATISLRCLDGCGTEAAVAAELLPVGLNRLVDGSRTGLVAFHLPEGWRSARLPAEDGEAPPEYWLCAGCAEKRGQA